MTASFDEIARIRFTNTQKKKMDLSDMRVRDCVVCELDKSVAREYISMFHYSKTFPDSTLYCYGAYYKEDLIGVITYGMGCGKNQYIAIVPDIKNGEYIELTRLWCSDYAKRNIESYLISHSLKMLPDSIKLVISFSDVIHNHCGIIYQASNFYYLGKNKGGKMLLTDKGIEKHPRLLGIYRMRHPEYKDMKNSELAELLGYKWVRGGIKHRYVYIRGNKAEKKKIYNLIKDRIEPYPKFDVKRPDMNEKKLIDEQIKKQGYVQLLLDEYLNESNDGTQ